MRSTRTFSGARSPRLRVTRPPVAGLWHIGASTHPGPGPRRRLRVSRREGADEAADHAAAAREASRTLVNLSLSEISTVGASFAEDVEAYAAAGFDAIGIWEFKLPADDEANVALLARARPRRCGVRARRALGAASSRSPGMEGPADLARAHRCARGSVAAVRRLRAGVRRLPRRAARRAHARGGHADRSSTALAARRRGRARGCGRAVGFEPVHPTQRDAAGFVNSASPTPTRSSRRPGHPRVGILFDTYHLWDDPEVLPWIAANVGRIVGVHIARLAERRPHRPRPARRGHLARRASSSPRSPPPAGTAPSTSRSSRRRSSSGASRSTRPPAAPCARRRSARLTRA